MELNKVHHLDWLENGLPDKSVQLIIADPPYFEIKGEFDFIWSSFDEYLKDVEEWAKECKRILADNGTLFWYGDAKNIAYTQIVLDRHFELLNSLVWENTNPYKQQTRFSGDLRSFHPLTERVLMYDKGEDKSGLYAINANPDCFKSIKVYLDQEHEKTGLSLREMCQQYGSTCSHYFGFSTREKEQFAIPTKEKYELLQSTGHFRKDYEDLRREYEDLRREYEDLRRPFDNFNHFGDVIHIPNMEAQKHNHPTVKPEKLTRALILTCSRPNDLVFVPFAGSGTECAMAAKEGRQFIGFDIEAKYVDMANKRAQTHLSTPTLF
jgi:DNA modification methylase